MSTIEAEAPTAPEQPDHASTAVAEMQREELFRWNAWVHVGAGVEECRLTLATEDADRDAKRELPACTDPGHFHAWCRLPNQFQRRDIVEKAKAARARKMRELRDPDSDAALILEGDLDMLREESDRDALIEEIIARESQQDMLRAVNEVMDEEADEDPDEETGEIPKVYDGIDQDFEEFDRLNAVPEDAPERDQDAIDRLRKHIDAYNDAVQAAFAAIQQVRRDAMSDRAWDDIVMIVRNDRRNWIANEAQLAAYSIWQMYVCTLKPRKQGTPNERVWGDLNAMRMNCPPEVSDALRATFDRLGENWSGSQRAKNS